MERIKFSLNRFFIKTFFVFGIILFCSVSFAFGASKVGFIDMQKAISSTKLFQKEMVKYQESYKSEQAKINAREIKIKETKDELEKQNFVLSPELKKQKEDQWKEEFKNFKRYVQDKNEDFQNLRDDIGRKILVKMLDVVRKVGKEKNYTVILENKVVLYSDQSVDLTDEIVKQFDKETK